MFTGGIDIGPAPHPLYCGSQTHCAPQYATVDSEAVILDLHSRRVVGWAASDRMKKDLAIRALDMAVRLRNPPHGCLFHSDRGNQYCSDDYQKKLQAYGLRPSMSGKGNCHDNASVEACPMIHQIIGCCALQISEGGAYLAAEMVNAATS